MTSRPPHRHDPQVRRDRLANWLALLTLLGLGVVWPGEETSGVVAQPARSALPGGRSVTQGTPSLRPQAPGGYALP